MSQNQLPYYQNEELSSFKLELATIGRKIIAKYVIDNETIKQELERGMDEALKKFDFTDIVRQVTEEQVRRAIEQADVWATLKAFIQERIKQKIYLTIQKQEPLINELIAKSLTK